MCNGNCECSVKDTPIYDEQAYAHAYNLGAKDAIDQFRHKFWELFMVKAGDARVIASKLRDEHKGLYQEETYWVLEGAWTLAAETCLNHFRGDYKGHPWGDPMHESDDDNCCNNEDQGCCGD